MSSGDPKGRATCYCTLVTSDSYVVGVQALVLSTLKNSIIERPFVVLHTEGVSKTSLKVLQRVKHVILVKVDALKGPVDAARTVAAWQDYTKLTIWSMEAYQRVVYLDADMLVMRSIDELFDVDLGDARFAAAPDVFPPDRFNAGLLVVEPDISVFQRMIERLPSLKSYDGGDTGFLNAYFPDWYSLPAPNRLPFTYNAQRTMYWFTRSQPGYWEALGDIKVLHFSSSPKPWLEQERKGDLEMLWWSTYTELLSWSRSLKS
jgi:glycogenin glucosyltransferase